MALSHDSAPFRSKLSVELEFTPSYWRPLVTDGLSPRCPEHGQAVALLARCLAAAMQLDGVVRLAVERTRLAVAVRVPVDTTLAQLCHRAGALREGLEALDHSFLAARAKYLNL